MDLSCLFLQTQLDRSIGKQLRQFLTTSMLPIIKLSGYIIDGRVQWAKNRLLAVWSFRSFRLAALKPLFHVKIKLFQRISDPSRCHWSPC